LVAFQDHAQATFELAQMFSEDRDGEQNSQTAAFWFQVEAGLGNAKAMKALSQVYRDGRSMPPELMETFVTRYAVRRYSTLIVSCNEPGRFSGGFNSSAIWAASSRNCSDAGPPRSANS
jgi:TPR repeat protein